MFFDKKLFKGKSNLERSILSHDLALDYYINKKYDPAKCLYHGSVRAAQIEKNRILTKAEKKAIWKTSVANKDRHH